MAELAVGIHLPTREAVLFDDVDAADVVDQAVAAEELGFDSVWVGDSIVARPRLDPFTTLAAIAGRTRRVALGTAVLLPALRPPLAVAHAVATLDQLSGGRVVLGVGAGGASPATEREFASLGVPYDERVGRMWATLELLRSAWAGSTGPWASRYWSFDEIHLEPAPVQPQGPPIWLGGHGPRMLRRAGGEFDGWLPLSRTPELFAAQLAEVRAAAEQAGRAPDAVTAAAYLTVTIDDDAGRAGDEQKRYMEDYYGVPFDPAKAVQACCAGPAEEVGRWLRSYVAAGARHLVVRFAGRNGAEQLQRAAPLLAQLR